MVAEGNETANNSDDRANRTISPDGGRSRVDRIVACLGEHRRRLLLYYLAEREHAGIDDAARYVVAAEDGCDPDDVSDEAHERAKVDLYHCHLPTLADLDVLEYDGRSGAMRFRDPPDGLADFLDLAAAVETTDSLA